MAPGAGRAGDAAPYQFDAQHGYASGPAAPSESMTAHPAGAGAVVVVMARVVVVSASVVGASLTGGAMVVDAPGVLDVLDSAVVPPGPCTTLLEEHPAPNAATTVTRTMA
ncbi:MAG: hypothetical protein IPP16_14930 [Acidimicrobiaceae bacterium]|nr:hypothetical protein [Acidimicrobiaceae bacterium]